MNRLLLLLVLLPLLSLQAMAQDENYIETGQWQVSVGLGLGVKSNPLAGGKNIPLVVVPDVAYYGEAFYFDNGDLGYTFADTQHWSLSIMSRINPEGAYFSLLHPNNIFLGAQTATDALDPDHSDPDYEGTLPSLDDLATRKFAIDVGAQFNLYCSDHSSLVVEILADINNVYKGINGLIEYQAMKRVGQWKLGLGGGLKFKSSGLIDYYYGVDQRDNVEPRYYYQGQQTIEPFIKLNASYPLSEKWQVLLLAKWRKLASGIENSPVVAENKVSTVFAGVSYEF